MGMLEGKVALITGVARGQGRSHAVRMAEEGADIIGVDSLADFPTVPYPLAAAEDLEETVRLVEDLDRRIIASQVDVRDLARLRQTVDEGVRELGRLDIVLPNAGIFGLSTVEEMTEEEWDEMIAVCLTGVWKTAKVAIPHLRASGGGSMIFTSSGAGAKSVANAGHYCAAKAGVIALTRTLAIELVQDGIRCNCVLPGNVNTGMLRNDFVPAVFTPDVAPEDRTDELVQSRYAALTVMGIPWLEPVDISNAMVWLASDAARYVTGVALPVDAGFLIK